MKGSLYKKETTSICHFCDYNCRKNHKCNWYKRFIKKWRKKKNGN